MEPSTQEDSLIFASETRKRAPQWLWLDPPVKLDAVDDTLIDRSGSVDEDSFPILEIRKLASNQPDVQ
ncbi:hypothetical protein HF325_002998 [Metschnikowia pulcherrima]|uniref:Uncharacterized protein n=1 Tax=Metschnikowia pulcherrima TaxID=27326 RepID=A0A8H7GUM1_9ASCO|nr:hypothetical protein HF325_002998 [Metschnikowia pulcherrima]